MIDQLQMYYQIAIWDIQFVVWIKSGTLFLAVNQTVLV